MQHPATEMISVVTPAYNEADNLPAMYERLAAALSPLGLEWEWLIIDDASGDSTFSVAARIAELHPGVQVKRFSRNFGSHVQRLGTDLLSAAPWRSCVVSNSLAAPASSLWPQICKIRQKPSLPWCRNGAPGITWSGRSGSARGRIAVHARFRPALLLDHAPVCWPDEYAGHGRGP